jgi:hypothetical protein
MTGACLLVFSMVGTAWGAGEKVFLGYLHSHTRYSDGSGVPEDAYKAAKSAGLDFLAVTEHNHSQCEEGAGARADGIMIAKDHALYNGPDSSSVISAANRLNEDGVFVTLYGQEFSSISKSNHINVFDVSDVIDDHEVPNGAVDKLVNNWLPAHKASNGKPAILQFNHPFNRANSHFEREYGKDKFGSLDEWVRRVGDLARTIEMLNGPGTVEGALKVKPEEVAESQFLKFLNLGFHLAPTGDQDNHYTNWAVETNARTGVITDKLTRSNILDALDARHVYATEDRNLRVIFRVNDHLCGDRIKAPSVGEELNVQYSLSDDDEPSSSYKIEVFSGTVRGGPAQVIETVTADGNGDGKIEDLKYTGGPQFFFFKITQSNEDGESDRAWTAPVWFDLDASSLPTLPPGADDTPPSTGGTPPTVPIGGENNFVASKNSNSYHLSLECLDAQRIKPSNRILGADARRGRTLHPGCPRTTGR